jgi:hypothetical protein
VYPRKKPIPPVNSQKSFRPKTSIPIPIARYTKFIFDLPSSVSSYTIILSCFGEINKKKQVFSENTCFS